ncbi:MAG: glycosyltransferase family 2 protein [Patescibacteria group bacterium]
MKDNLPTISIIIPTLNAAGPLPECLRRIVDQDYPKGKVEIIVADGGSTDTTRKIAKKFGAKIVENKLKTGEAGKAAGVRAAKNEIIALIDSDNYLSSKDWLKRMVEPFADPEIIGSEPIEYTYRKEDGYITRYCALMGMNDPICLFLGNYDRKNYLTGRWTDLPVINENKGNYLKLTLEKYKIPTIGANGTLFRREVIIHEVRDYLFDIDAIPELVSRGKNKFAKVKVGIIHVFSGDVHTFIRKQKRRITDYAYHKRLNIRKYPWTKFNKIGFVKFILFSTLVIPAFLQSCRGYIKRPDRAWFFHPLACWLSVWIYSLGFMSQFFFQPKEFNRDGWKQ